jgi:hypothetical protein
MTRYRARAVLLLSLFLIFATPVVGQEAGQRARGEVAPGILDSVAPMWMVEGVITPDLLQLEMEDGTILARDVLINPEYFASKRPNFLSTALAVGVVSVVGKLILEQIVGRAVDVGTCVVISSVSPGEEDCLDGAKGESPIPSYPVTFGLGAAVGASLWVIPSAWRFDWKPW